MWKLSKIDIRNIVSIKEASLTISQGVATLIFGQNEDNSCQPCNGSGKSSIVEAISFALTGEQLRKVKSVEEIINDHSDIAYVRLTLENDYDGTTFVIERTISRNAPQTIVCHKYNAVGDEIEQDKTVQATVLDYNRFILSEIGLTKDDIYNNYILCDNKYESFFDCSDKSKKEVINRFSNGAIVDEGIERLHADIVPVEIELSSANEKLMATMGAVRAIESELQQAQEKTVAARQDKANRIAHLDEQIQKCRADMQDCENKLQNAQERIDTLKTLRSKTEQMESNNLSLLDAYTRIVELCAKYSLESVSSYSIMSKQYKDDLAQAQKIVLEIKRKIEIASAEYERLCNELANQKAAYEKCCDDEQQLKAKDKEGKDKLLAEIDAIDDLLDKIQATIDSNKKRRSELEVEISRSKALLSGAVTCPKCDHVFFVDSDESFADVSSRITKIETEIAQVNNENRVLEERFDAADSDAESKMNEVKAIDVRAKHRAEDIEQESSKLKAFVSKVDEMERTLARFEKQLVEAETDTQRINGKIEMLRNRLFAEIYGIIEGRLTSGYNFIGQQKQSILFLDGQKNRFLQLKQELLETPETDFVALLKESLDKNTKELETAQTAYNTIKVKYDKLKEQETHFAMFKSYLAKKKIDALALIVNDFLQKIGSDIRLKLEGFTMTKTGKLRDKISVQVMRDGVDCGSYQKFSGGERARLNLACILSLHTLTNSNCEDGKGLDFIIIDELLDKSDEVGMATYCEALNKLKQTALLITQGSVTEGYPHKILVTKRKGISTIED